MRKKGNLGNVILFSVLLCGYIGFCMAQSQVGGGGSTANVIPAAGGGSTATNVAGNGLIVITSSDGATNTYSLGTNTVQNLITNQIITVTNAGAMTLLRINADTGLSGANNFLNMTLGATSIFQFTGSQLLNINGGASIGTDRLWLKNGTGAVEIGDVGTGQGANVALVTGGTVATTNSIILYGNGLEVGELARFDKRGMKLGTNGVYIKTFGGTTVTTNFGTVAQAQGIQIIEGVSVLDAALGDVVNVGLPLQYTNYPLLYVVGTVTSAITVQLRAVNIQTVGNYVTTNDVITVKVWH